jgi:hypothetical protein
MPIELIDKIVPTDEQLKEAIAILCSECFTALVFANALGGPRQQSITWRLIHTFKAKELFDECRSRNIDLTTLKVGVGEGFVKDTKLYVKMVGE